MIVSTDRIRTNQLGTRYVVVHVGGERVIVKLPKEG